MATNAFLHILKTSERLWCNKNLNITLNGKMLKVTIYCNTNTSANNNDNGVM